MSKPRFVPKDYDQFEEHFKQFGTNAVILQNAETIWCNGLPKQDVREMDKTVAAMSHISGYSFGHLSAMPKRSMASAPNIFTLFLNIFAASAAQRIFV